MAETNMETAYLMVWLNQVLSERPQKDGFYSMNVSSLTLYTSTLCKVDSYAELGRYCVDILLFRQLSNLAFRVGSSDGIADRDADRDFVKAILNLFSQRVDWESVGRLIATKVNWTPNGERPPLPFGNL